MRPAQHYTMGGVRTNYTGESPTLKGLFAAGEAACWDMHGFNRLGGNSVAETVVAGMIVGEFIADYCDKPENDAYIPTGLVREFVARESARLQGILVSRGTEDASAIKARMQEIMTGKVGIFRSGKDLGEAVDELQKLLVRSRAIGLKSSAPGANPELVTAYRMQKMLKLALCVSYGALTRTESRGAHFREDFPRRNGAEWLKRTLATWKGDETLPTLNYEPLDVSRPAAVPDRDVPVGQRVLLHPDLRLADRGDQLRPLGDDEDRQVRAEPLVGDPGSRRHVRGCVHRTRAGEGDVLKG